jgi:hypothetical protein
MPLQVDSLEAKPDIARLIEDLSATIPLYRAVARAGRVVHPSTALLQLLGEAFLDHGPLDQSQVVQRAGGFPTIVDTFLVSAFDGSVRLSYFLMALVLGRPGLRAHFLRHGAYDWTGCLRWLVLHGVREAHLWPYLSEGFVRELRAPSLLVEGKRLSVLQAIAMAERPDVLAAFRAETSPTRFARFFTDWFLRRGSADYEHAWLMSGSEVDRKMRQDPSGAWTGAAPPEPEDGSLPDHDFFPNEPLDPPSPTALARAAGRAQYRHFGPNYPCAYLDVSDPNAALTAVAGGDARAGLRGGLDLVSPYVELRLPDTRQSNVMLRLDLAVPERLRDELFVRIRVRDAFGPSGFSRRFSGHAISARPLVIPLVLRQMALRLEISFALAGRGAGSLRDLGFTFATLRSLHVWQVIAEDEALATLAVEAA